MERYKITIIRIQKPEHRSINNELQWFGTSLGLFNLRDKDKSCFRLFIELVKSAKAGTPLSSDEIASRLDLTRGTIIHHMNTLMKAGIVMHRPEGYILRAESMAELVDVLKSDVDKYFSALKDVGSQIDEYLQL